MKAACLHLCFPQVFR